MFFKEIFLDAPLSKAKCYVIRIEFQVSGSQNIHSFLWIVNAPILSEKTIEFYTEWLDQMISAELQDKSSKPTMFELVKNFQLHRHSKSYQKFSNGKSRFNFCRFFTERTIVAKLLSERLTEHEKAEIIFVRSTILNKVKANIDSELNSSNIIFMINQGMILNMLDQLIVFQISWEYLRKTIIMPYLYQMTMTFKCT